MTLCGDICGESTDFIDIIFYTYKKTFFFNISVHVLSKLAASSTQKSGMVSVRKFFITSISGTGITDRLNCRRLAADSGVPDI